MEDIYKLKADKYKIKYLNLKNRILDLQTGSASPKPSSPKPSLITRAITFFTPINELDKRRKDNQDRIDKLYNLFNNENYKSRIDVYRYDDSKNPMNGKLEFDYVKKAAFLELHDTNNKNGMRYYDHFFKPPAKSPAKSPATTVSPDTLVMSAFKEKKYTERFEKFIVPLPKDKEGLTNSEMYLDYRRKNRPAFGKYMEDNHKNLLVTFTEFLSEKYKLLYTNIVHDEVSENDSDPIKTITGKELDEKKLRTLITDIIINGAIVKKDLTQSDTKKPELFFKKLLDLFYKIYIKIEIP
jgi:hypothetical protein